MELAGNGFLLRLHRRDRALELGDFGHQCLRACRVRGPLGLADLLRRRIAARLRLLEPENARAPAFVETEEPRRLARQSAPCQTPIECVRIIANPFDVVHEGTPE